jgi:hypothetical protein
MNNKSIPGVDRSEILAEIKKKKSQVPREQKKFMSRCSLIREPGRPTTVQTTYIGTGGRYTNLASVGYNVPSVYCAQNRNDPYFAYHNCLRSKSDWEKTVSFCLQALSPMGGSRRTYKTVLYDAFSERNIKCITIKTINQWNNKLFIKPSVWLCKTYIFPIVTFSAAILCFLTVAEGLLYLFSRTDCSET